MPAEGLEPRDARGSPCADLIAELTDARLVARMRLVLALAVLLALQIEPTGMPGMDPSRWPVFVAYGLYSFAVDVAAERPQDWTRSPALHWLDVAWYALMVALTGGVGSLVFLFFFFAILTASLRWGRSEGGRVTLASALAFAGATLLAQSPPDLTRLLLRTSFMLGLGHLCVHWGQTQVQLKRRLALLREVGRLSNPRFGVEQTLAHVLARTREFFEASHCLLVLREEESGKASVRGMGPEGQAQPGPQALSQAMADALLPFEPRLVVAHSSRHGMRPARTWCLAGQGRWQPAAAALARQAAELAEWTEARHVISVPVALRQGRGRLHVCRQGPSLSREDALFLGQLVAQAFPVIDHIDLLDRMASEAATRERQRFALDLHDTAIQPYIGLKLGLAALRHKAEPDNPLVSELDKLEAMAARVTEDLRRYARKVREHSRSESALLAQLREQAAQVRDFYGVDIDVQVEGEFAVGDRLSAEVLQVVREGLANICKHTLAQRGAVSLQCRGGWLGIRIANEGVATGAALDFTPRSLSERAAALGGRTHVQHDERGHTCVHIHIPV